MGSIAPPPAEPLLHDLHVVDLGRHVGAPSTAMALADLGAEVIKIEQAPNGDPMRKLGPHVHGESPFFTAVNRNKRGMAVNLHDADGIAIVRRLAASWADVVIDNFRDGVMEGWELDHSSLAQENPRIVTATLRGYPEGDRRSSVDLCMQAATGIMSLTGPAGGEFYKVEAPITDMAAGLYLLIAILSALRERDRSGHGQHVSVSLWESSLALLMPVGEAVLMTGERIEHSGNAHPGVAPYEIFRADDGPFAMSVLDDKRFALLADALDRPDWVEDRRYRTNPQRVANRASLVTEIDQALRGRSRKELLPALEGLGISCAPLLHVDEALASPDAALAHIVERVPSSAGGEIPLLRMPWHFSGSRSEPCAPAPALGQHSRAILEALGFDAPRIDDLEARGAVLTAQEPIADEGEPSEGPRP